MDFSKEFKREGVRGGREQFSWDSLKTQSHRDRAQYLGYSTKLGVAGRFGKYDRNDWWRTQQSSSSSKSQLHAERYDAKKLEEELMMEALGLKPKQSLNPVPPTKQDGAQVSVKREDASKPSSTIRAAAPGASAAGMEDGEDAKQVTGLGFRKYLKATDYTEVQDVDDMLEANGEEIVIQPMVKKETDVQAQKPRVFGPARPPGVPVKEEQVADDDRRRNRSRSRDRRDRR